MSDYEVRITLNAESGPAQAGIRAVNRNLESMGPAAQRGIRMADREARGFQSTLRDLGRVAMGALTAFAGQQMLQMVGNLRELGSEAGYLRVRLEALVGGPERLGAALDGLREKTGGVINDMQLTRDAVNLMMTGVADDVDQAGDIIKLGLQLAGQEGAAVLGQALKNSSFQLLDNVGISATQVRELAAQYRAAGLDASAAFTRATLEIGQGVVDSLGAAADAGVTSFDRLRTHFENTMQNVAIGTADIIEQMAQDIERIFAAHDEFWRRNSPDNYNPAVGMTTRQFAQAGAALASGRTSLQTLEQERQLRGVIAREAAYAALQREQQERAINALVERRRQEEEAWRARANYSENVGPLSRLMDDAFGMATRYGASEMTARESMRRYPNVPGEFGNQILFEGVPEFVSREQADTLSSMADAAARMLADVEAAHEAGLAGIDDAALEAARGYADTVKTIATEAGKAADNFERATLAMAFGQGARNPIAADIERDILNAARDSGLFSADELAALTDQLALYSGAQTDASLIWRDDVVPLLVRMADEFGPEAVVGAAERLEAALRTGLLAGDTPDDIIQRALNSLGFIQLLNKDTGDFSLVEAKPGWGSDGGPPSAEMELLAGAAETYADAVERGQKAQAMGKPAIADMNAELDQSYIKIVTFGKEVKAIAEAEYELRFKLVGDSKDAPPWLVQLIDSRVALMAVKNGGVIPGTAQRTR